jgi:hypothetical protein
LPISIALIDVGDPFRLVPVDLLLLLAMAG